MSFKIKGLVDFQKNLDKLSKNAQALSGEHDYSFDEIFSDRFMSENTNFKTIQEFLLSSPENISNPEDFKNADEAIIDTFVSQQTKFSTWREMMTEASKTLLTNRLGF
ncbi:hypothetical protein [Streptococcus moroccensis]|uniref:Uncharacterized protein n=1 Tax=Streptococcus moroccensis TaxID=1451356 RepID=A0ABT9YQK7_9STRE|nr:hypothetical protein [Streptococcus moroccensis]MDQ0222278.1 hypothetical protein [Streptococcus moroccensis]